MLMQSSVAKALSTRLAHALQRVYTMRKMIKSAPWVKKFHNPKNSTLLPLSSGGSPGLPGKRAFSDNHLQANRPADTHNQPTRSSP
jgi:hypothetical protein